MVKVALKILSPLPLTKREDGKMILDLWQKYLPNLLPDKFGNWEPIDRLFDPRHIETALDAWQWPFLSTKKNPAVDASIWMRKGARQRLHSSWNFDLDSDAAKQTVLVMFLKEASVALQADFSYLHLITSAELEQGRASGMAHKLDKRATKFFFSIYSKDLQGRIPNLLWATVFGAPYAEMFGRDRLLSAPAYVAESLSDEMVFLQMTDQLTDVERNPPVFNEARSRVKVHLGPEAFFDPERSGTYRAPKFDFV